MHRDIFCSCSQPSLDPIRAVQHWLATDGQGTRQERSERCPRRGTRPGDAALRTLSECAGIDRSDHGPRATSGVFGLAQGHSRSSVSRLGRSTQTLELDMPSRTELARTIWRWDSDCERENVRCVPCGGGDPGRACASLQPAALEFNDSSLSPSCYLRYQAHSF